MKSIHKELMAYPNVVGVGTGYKTSGGERTGRLGHVVFVERKLPASALAAEAVLPLMFDGEPVDVVEIGKVVALQSPTDRWRPAPPGVSVGHYQITAGTFGAVVGDKQTEEKLILSNNHVLANSNAGLVGDPILQPGPADGGTVENDTIATLLRFHPIVWEKEPNPPQPCPIASLYTRFGNFAATLLGSTYRLENYIYQDEVNLIDAALARPVSEDIITNEVLNIGEVHGIVPAYLNQMVRKSGRTTGYNEGEVIAIDATVRVGYMYGAIAVFEDQIVTTKMAEGGDSGSLVVDLEENKATGLLFAGSNTNAIHNKIENVLSIMDVFI